MTQIDTDRFKHDLATLTDLNLNYKKELHTSAERRQAYFDALDGCTCVLRDIGHEVSYHEMMIEDKNVLGRDTTKHVQDLKKVKNCIPGDACKFLLSILDETPRVVFNCRVPSEDLLNHLDASDNEKAIRQYIKEIHGF